MRCKLVMIMITAETHDWIYFLLAFFVFAYVFPCDSVAITIFYFMFFRGFSGFRGHYDF